MKEGAATIAQVPAVIKDLDKVFKSSFTAPISAKTAEFMKIYESSDLANKPFKQLKNTVHDKLNNTLTMLQGIVLYLTLLVPKIEDGGNFGVTIQMSLIKQVSEMIKSWNTISKTIQEYHVKREGHVTKLMKSKKTSTATVDVKEAAEKDKVGKTVTTTETIAEGEINSEQYETLAAIDVEMYAGLQASVLGVRNNLITLHDFYTKNEKKILKPRGSSGGSYY